MFLIEPNPLVCPKCLRQAHLATVNAQTVTALVVFSVRETKPRVRCRDCAQRYLRGAQWHNGLAGWWGIRAFFSNIGALNANYRELKQTELMSAPGELMPDPAPAELAQLDEALARLGVDGRARRKNPVEVAKALAEATGLPPDVCMLYTVRSK